MVWVPFPQSKQQTRIIYQQCQKMILQRVLSLQACWLKCSYGSLITYQINFNGPEVHLVWRDIGFTAARAVSMMATTDSRNVVQNGQLPLGLVPGLLEKGFKVLLLQTSEMVWEGFVGDKWAKCPHKLQHKFFYIHRQVPCKNAIQINGTKIDQFHLSSIIQYLLLAWYQ